MNFYKDQETLYEFLKEITSIEEFFARKEPAFDDEFSRQVAQAMIEDGSEPDSVLSALKAQERSSYADSLQLRRAPH